MRLQAWRTHHSYRAHRNPLYPWQHSRLRQHLQRPHFSQHPCSRLVSRCDQLRMRVQLQSHASARRAFSVFRGNTLTNLPCLSCLLGMRAMSKQTWQRLMCSASTLCIHLWNLTAHCTITTIYIQQHSILIVIVQSCPSQGSTANTRADLDTMPPAAVLPTGPSAQAKSLPRPEHTASSPSISETMSATSPSLPKPKVPGAQLSAHFACFPEPS